MLAFIEGVWAIIAVFLGWARGLPALVSPWVLKLLSTGSIIYIVTGLGFGVVVYKGLDIAFQTVIDLMVSSWSGAAGNAIALASLAGIPTAANAILSAHATGIAIKVAATSLKKFGFIGQGAS